MEIIKNIITYFSQNTTALKILWIIIITFILSSYIYIKKYCRDIKYARRELGISTRSNWQMRNAPKYFKMSFFSTYLNAYFHISILMAIVSIVYINSFSILGNEFIMFFIPLLILCSEIINSNTYSTEEQEQYNQYTFIQNLFDIINLIKNPIINIFKNYSPRYFVEKELKVLIVKLKDSNYQCYEKYYKNNQDTHLGEYIIRLKDIVLRNVGEEKLKKDELSEYFNLNSEEQRLELEYKKKKKKSLENLIRYYIDSLNCDNNTAAIQIYYELNTFLNNPQKYANVKSFISLATLQTELNQSAQDNHKDIEQINKEIQKFYDANYLIKQVNDYINEDEMRKEFEGVENLCRSLKIG